jgi:hypothetical protein
LFDSRQGGAGGGGAEVAIQQAEVDGRVDDRGIAPVDDAGHPPGARVDQDMLDAGIVVGEHRHPSAGRRWRLQERLHGSAVHHRDLPGDHRIGLGRVEPPLIQRPVIDASQRGHELHRRGMQRGEQLAERGGDRAGMGRQDTGSHPR